MTYQIIKNQISADNSVCYAMFRRTAAEEELTASTYGYIASEFGNGVTVDDVLTDEETAMALLSLLALKSVKPAKLEEYIMQYIEKL